MSQMLKAVFSSRIPRWFGAEAIVLYPYAFFTRDKYHYLALDRERLVHEAEHGFQIMALGVFRFYWQYMIEFMVRLVRYRNWNKAYLEIPFEVEARRSERDPLNGNHLSILGID
jgi:hypothetical protein